MATRDEQIEAACCRADQFQCGLREVLSQVALTATDAQWAAILREVKTAIVAARDRMVLAYRKRADETEVTPV